MEFPRIASRDGSKKGLRRETAQDELYRRYCAEVRGAEVLNREEEFNLAATIAALDRKAWCAILSSNALIRVARSAAQFLKNEVPQQLNELLIGWEPADIHRFHFIQKITSAADMARELDIDGEVRNHVAESCLPAPDPKNPKSPLTHEHSIRLTGMARELVEAVNLAQLARSRFVQGNLRFVIAMAIFYRRRYREPALMDMIQEGNVGLLKAVNRYDPSKGCRFSTYATWWIRHMITRAIANKSRLIRVPVKHHFAYGVTMQKENQIRVKYGLKASSEDIARELDIDPLKVDKLRTECEQSTFSLDWPIFPHEGRPAAEVLSMEGADPAGSEELQSKELFAQCESILGEMPRRDALVLKMRFGFIDGVEYTLNEIGDKLAVSRERVRQIQNQALAKLRRELQRRKAI